MTQTSNSNATSNGLRARINNIGLSKPAILGLMTLLVLFAGWSAYIYSPRDATRQVIQGDEQESKDMLWLRSKVSETGGDITRLSASDRAEADRIAKATTGMSATAMFNNKPVEIALDSNQIQARRAQFNWQQSRIAAAVAQKHPNPAPATP